MAQENIITIHGIKRDGNRREEQAIFKTRKGKTSKLKKDKVVIGNSETVEVVEEVNITEDQTEADTEIEIPVSDPFLCTVQSARSVCTWIKGEKPRVVYSCHRLTERKQVSWLLHMSEYEYTFGPALFPPLNAMSKKVMCRSNLTCSMPIELAYYSSGLGNVDVLLLL